MIVIIRKSSLIIYKNPNHFYTQGYSYLKKNGILKAIFKNNLIRTWPKIGFSKKKNSLKYA
ncbi:hypothetical protein MYP_2580 [Sporocytophaga myxococcoides]|uniref:Uncharacterized protein n=1 Tax=Sporocytophaga myxococcoides TaxID=153721 RepID=A0A098LEL1_9BACT|nr:hypothetical protein MYP_2580 [Sporocytophaga myxococcoides]